MSTSMFINPEFVNAEVRLPPRAARPRLAAARRRTGQSHRRASHCISPSGPRARRHAGPPAT